MIVAICLLLLCFVQYPASVSSLSRGVDNGYYGRVNAHEMESEYDYDYDYDEYTQEKDYRQESEDYVSHYTKTLSSKMIVSASSAIGSFVLGHLILSMLFSVQSLKLDGAIAMLSAAFTFIKGDIGDFCRATGVCAILLMQRTSFQRFLVKFTSQMKSVVMMAERRPFPPGSNPWKYVPAGGEGEVAELRFSMMHTLLAVVLSSAFMGWLVAKPIPLFPNWIGALGAAGVLGSAASLRDSRGDMLRYVGYCLHNCFSIVMMTFDDVELKDKAGRLLGRLLFFLKGIDNKYHIVARLQDIFSDIIARVTVLVGSIRSQAGGMDDDEDDTGRDYYGDASTGINTSRRTTGRNKVASSSSSGRRSSSSKNSNRRNRSASAPNYDENYTSSRRDYSAGDYDDYSQHSQQPQQYYCGDEAEYDDYQ